MIIKKEKHLVFFSGTHEMFLPLCHTQNIKSKFIIYSARLNKYAWGTLPGAVLNKDNKDKSLSSRCRDHNIKHANDCNAR